MTLTELAKKHDIPHDKAVAFLRDWLDAQPVAYFRVEHFDGGYEFMFKETWQKVRKVTPLIARPELGDL